MLPMADHHSVELGNSYAEHAAFRERTECLDEYEAQVVTV
jgi:hypothetical protein